MSSGFKRLKRVNLTIETALHKLAKTRARKVLKLSDGFSGYVSRLIKLDIKRKRRRISSIPRLMDSPGE